MAAFSSVKDFFKNNGLKIKKPSIERGFFSIQKLYLLLDMEDNTFLIIVFFQLDHIGSFD